MIISPHRKSMHMLEVIQQRGWIYEKFITLLLFLLSFLSLCSSFNSLLPDSVRYLWSFHTLIRTALLCLCQPAKVVGMKQKGARSGRAENRWLSGNPACPTSIIDRQRRDDWVRPYVCVCVSLCVCVPLSYRPREFLSFTNHLLFSVFWLQLSFFSPFHGLFFFMTHRIHTHKSCPKYYKCNKAAKQRCSLYNNRDFYLFIQPI